MAEFRELRRPEVLGPYSSGTFVVTGTSAGFESDGAHVVTLAGIIHGTTVDRREAHARLLLGADDAPGIGTVLPIAYESKNPDKWWFVPTHEPPQPPPATATELT